MILYKSLVLDRNTWNHRIVHKLLVLDRNTWNHIIVQKSLKKQLHKNYKYKPAIFAIL